jgi:predicted amidohydrolase
MRLTLVQSALIWQNAAANRHQFTRKLAGLVGTTDLVVLPEMFTTGFSMDVAQLAEPMEGPTMEWLIKTAEYLGSAVVGSFICAENGCYYNRLAFVRPDGRYDCYDKRHLFGLGGEQDFFTSGNNSLVVTWEGFRIRPLICYDLRFPVWSRNQVEEPYDLLLYIANWPSRRAQHWRALLTARAIENQSFVAGINIVGSDGNGLEYAGDSTLVNFSGEQIFQLSAQEGVFTVHLDTSALIQYRAALPFLRDADLFVLKQ